MWGVTLLYFIIIARWYYDYGRWSFFLFRSENYVFIFITYCSVLPERTVIIIDNILQQL